VEVISFDRNVSEDEDAGPSAEKERDRETHRLREREQERRGRADLKGQVGEVQSISWWKVALLRFCADTSRDEIRFLLTR
jgi:hypothetical protein